MNCTCCCCKNCPKNDEVAGSPKIVDGRKRTTLDFINDPLWNVTLSSFGSEKSPKIVEFPELDILDNSDYQITPYGIRMQALVNGFTTTNTKYPRCEFRELEADKSKASWDCSEGTHTLKVITQVLKLPKQKPEICIAQLHDKDDDVFEIRYEKDQVVISGVPVSPALKIPLETDININVKIDYGVCSIDINNYITKFTLDNKGCYFKAGCYVQSNVSKEKSKTEKGQVLLKYLKVSHSKK